MTDETPLRSPEEARAYFDKTMPNLASRRADFRQLLADLIAAFDTDYADRFGDGWPKFTEVRAKADIALAQPVPPAAAPDNSAGDDWKLRAACENAGNELTVHELYDAAALVRMLPSELARLRRGGK